MYLHRREKDGGRFLVICFFPGRGELAQLARAFEWHSKGHRFDSGILHKGRLNIQPPCFLCPPVNICSQAPPTLRAIPRPEVHDPRQEDYDWQVCAPGELIFFPLRPCVWKVAEFMVGRRVRGAARLPGKPHRFCLTTISRFWPSRT